MSPFLTSKLAKEFNLPESLVPTPAGSGPFEDMQLEEKISGCCQEDLGSNHNSKTFLVVWPQANYLICLNFDFPFCKMGRGFLIGLPHGFWGVFEVRLPRRGKREEDSCTGDLFSWGSRQGPGSVKVGDGFPAWSSRARGRMFVHWFVLLTSKLGFRAPAFVAQGLRATKGGKLEALCTMGKGSPGNLCWESYV